MGADGIFVLHHQDGEMAYRFAKGGYALQDGSLALSVETRAVDPETYPERFLIAVEGQRVKAAFEEVHFETSSASDRPAVYVYVNFHAEDVQAKFQVTRLSDWKVSVLIDAVCEDVNYYDDKANPNAFRGRVELERKQLDKLWIPV